MLNFYFPLRSAYFAIPLLCLAVSVEVSAQQAGGGTDTGTAAGGAGGGAAVGPADQAVQLDDSAFDQVDRTGTLGAAAASIGSDAAARTGGAGGGIGGLGGFGGLGGGFGGLGGLFNAFGQGAAQSTRPPLRTRLRSAIGVPQTPPAQVQQVANVRFRNLSTQPQLRGINVTMQGRTAVIRGVVASERDRRMSELLMRLEPGVRDVDNQITIVE